MPYISDAERERVRWMTLAEGVTHIEERDRCDRDSAEQQIRNALGDGKLIIKWEDTTADQRRRRLPTDPPPMISDSPSQALMVPDCPPHKGGFWQEARIDGDKVLDPETGRRRTLLVLRRIVQQIWPEQSSTPPPEESRPQGGAPSYRDKIEKRLVGFDLTNIANATRHVRDT